MTTFYVLPSRQLLGQRFGDLLAAIFPGMSATSQDWPDLAESLAGFVELRHEACVVYGEDLDDTLSLRDALMRDFGAELGDEIIEVHFGSALHEIMHQRWSTEEVRRAA